MKPLVSISMLASRKIEDVCRCLDSLKPIMDALPCELILVDTSGQPQIGEVLRKYTQRVISFLWCDDFSKARNVGLEAATGEWFLYLDDDEWFVETKELIDFFCSGDYHNYGYANYIQRNFLDPELETYTDSWVSRLVRLTPEVRFQSRIHEYLSPIEGKGKNLKAIVNHTGYIYVNEEERKKRFLRNEPLLRRMMEEESDHLRWGIQLAQEYVSVEEWGLLEDLCRKALQNKEYQGQALMKRLAATFFAGIAESLIGQKEYAKCIEEIQLALRDKNCSPLGQAYLSLLCGICYFHQKDWQRAREAVETYFSLEREIVADEAQYIIWQEALLVDNAFDSINKKKAYSILLICELKEKEQTKVLECLDRLEWNKKAVYVFPSFLSVLFETLLEQNQEVYWKQIWFCLCKRKQIYDLAVKEYREIWNVKSKEQKVWFREEYKKQMNLLMKKYYKDFVMQKYRMLLPEFVQQAIGFIQNVESEECV